MSKFYNFVTNNNESELYLYGAIVSDKWYEDDVSFKDFKECIDNISNGSTLNVYVNSPGGEVFVCQSIISLLKRAKTLKNITINCTIDGLGASCASWLPMVADNIYIYKGSILMLHKPMCGCWGNANDMKKQIEILDKIEENEMLPMYMSKVKEGVTEDRIKEILSDETWLDSNEIQELFNVTMLEEEKKMIACVDNELFKNYRKVPEELIEQKNNNKELLNKLNKEIDIALAMC